MQNVIDKYHQVWENITVSPLLPIFWIFFFKFIVNIIVFLFISFMDVPLLPWQQEEREKIKRERHFLQACTAVVILTEDNGENFPTCLCGQRGPALNLGYEWVPVPEAAPHAEWGILPPCAGTSEKTWPVQVRGPLSCLSRENHPRKIGGVLTYPATPIHFTHWAADCPRKY